MISGILEKISPNSADLTQARAVRAVRYWYLVPNGAVQQCHELSFFFHCGVLLPSRVAARHNAPRRTAYASSRRPASRPRAQILARVRKCPRRRCVARVSHAIRGASAPQQPSWSVTPGRPHPPVSAGAVSQSCTSCVSFFCPSAAGDFDPERGRTDVGWPRGSTPLWTSSLEPENVASSPDDI